VPLEQQPKWMLPTLPVARRAITIVDLFVLAPVSVPPTALKRREDNTLWIDSNTLIPEKYGNGGVVTAEASVIITRLTDGRLSADPRRICGLCRR
jgi:hypothetical protein